MLQFWSRIPLPAAVLCMGIFAVAATPPKKPRVVVLGAARQAPYSRAGDPAGAGPNESSLKVRALLVDGRVSEWTTGEAHDVTDRSFVVRRALRINDTLPETPTNDAGSTRKTDADLKADARPAPKAAAKAQEHWVWQRGPWLLVDRLTGRVTALKLPDYDPAASQVAWFRDYAAYCGVTATGKSLYAVVAQIGVRRAVLSKKLSAYEAGDHAEPVCGHAEWQREPLQVTFHPAGRDAASFALAGGSTALVEDGADDDSAKP